MGFNSRKFRKWLRDRAHYSRAKSTYSSPNMKQHNTLNIGKAQAFELVLAELDKDAYWTDDALSISTDDNKD